MRLHMVLLCIALATAGCSTRSDVGGSFVGPQPLAGTRVWVGPLYGGLGGDCVLRLDITNGVATGTLARSGPQAAAVTGTVRGDSILLALAGGGALRGEVVHDSLYATLDPGGGSGQLAARAVPWKAFNNPARIAALGEDVTGAAFGQGLIWLPLADGRYLRLTTLGVQRDRITIEWPPGTPWAAKFAAWDGTRLWGTHPVVGGFTDLLGFTAAGRTPDSLRLGYMPWGLTGAGTDVWVLRPGPMALVRADGADSLDIETPDAYFLAALGGKFWMTAGFLHAIYALDAGGRVVAMYDSPAARSSSTLGLVSDGTSLFLVVRTGVAPIVTTEVWRLRP